MSAPDRLVGRDAELADVAAAVRHLAAGRATALVIDGEAGIGKTRLVSHLVDDARSQGATVFYGRTHPFERTRPFGVVVEALGVDRRSPDPRRAGIAELLTGADTAAAPSGPADLQYRVVDEVVDLVESTSAQQPVVLVAEDLHWADPGSLRALSSVARRLPLSPLLIVVTTRPSPVPGDVVRLLDDLAAAGASTIHLGPMTPEQIGELAITELGSPPGPVLTGLLAKAAGNPLWASAILSTLADEGMLRDTGDAVDATTQQLPTSLADLVVRTLRDLPPETLELLEVTAVLGDAVSVRDVATLARRSPAEVAARLEDAFEAHLLGEVDDRLVFRHPLVHDAVYQHLPAPARRLLHREAAVTLMAGGADPLDVADHLVHGAERGDEQVVAWLREAAAEASAQAPPVAVELLRRAEALLPAGHPEADPVSAALVGALLQAGSVREASTLAEAVLARRHSPEVDVPVRLALLGALALQNRADEVVRVAEATLATPPGLPPPAQVPVLAQLSWAHTYSGELTDGVAAARRGLAVAEEVADPAATVWALTALLVAVGRQGRYEEALDHARRAADLAARMPGSGALPLQPAYFLGLALFDCDLVAEARAAFRQALDGEFASGWWLSDTLMADALVSFVEGEWADAVPSLRAGADAAREKGHALLLTQSLAYQVVIATGVGDLRAARELAVGIVTALEGDRLGYNAGILGAAVAGLMAAEGDADGAYEVLLRCWRFEAERDDRFYHRCLAPDLVRLALALGHDDVAEEVAGVVAEGVALAPGVPTVRVLALRCRGLVLDDPDLLLEAVAVARTVPHLVEHAGACEDAASSLARRGRVEEATTLLTEALDRYETAGADAWAARVRAALRALGVHPGQRGPRDRPAGGWDSLTATERSVSLLVAEGLTNGAVARRLYISPHTVNTHLRHVFTKLGVSNRVALAGVVNRSIE